MPPRTVAPAPRFVLCLLLPVVGPVACGGGVDGDGGSPPPRIVAEHPVTSPAARRAGVVLDEMPAATPEQSPPAPEAEPPAPAPAAVLEPDPGAAPDPEPDPEPGAGAPGDAG